MRNIYIYIFFRPQIINIERGLETAQFVCRRPSYKRPSRADIYDVVFLCCLFQEKELVGTSPPFTVVNLNLVLRAAIFYFLFFYNWFTSIRNPLGYGRP